MGDRLWSLVALLVGAAVPSAHAADTTPTANDWVITVGADARAVPRYMGSNSYVAVPVPYFDAWRLGSREAFHSPRDGTGITLFDNGIFAIGPVGSLIWRRPQSPNPSLNGLGEVGFTGLIGGFADYWGVPWLRSRVEVMAGVGGATGLQTNLFLDAVVPLSTAMTWSGGLRGRFVTGGLESTYFSITQAQSIASGLPIYQAGNGWQAVGAGTQLKYRFSPTWASYAFVEYDKLVGATASSPVVTGPGGSSNQWTVGFGLIYSFVLTGIPF
ncbi:MAG: MipA/OmpV family protein [Bradyrhizobium sp.]|nr:MipA/OmpV family protein [Bradyrhizobium sp.]